MELVQSIASQLGVSEDQAKSGAGVLLGAAEKKLSPDEFQMVSRLIPGLKDILKAGTKAGDGKSGGGLAGIVLALVGMLGLMNKDKLGRAKQLLVIVAIFKKLGLTKADVLKFAQAIMSFLNSKGGGMAADIFGKVLTGGAAKP
jgi:hypothetical protein